MIIINGRKTGNPFGKFTLYQWNGQAVVDYTISSFELLDKITYFKVGDIPHLSLTTVPFSLKYTQSSHEGKTG